MILKAKQEVRRNLKWYNSMYCLGLMVSESELKLKFFFTAPTVEICATSSHTVVTPILIIFSKFSSVREKGKEEVVKKWKTL